MVMGQAPKGQRSVARAKNGTLQCGSRNSTGRIYNMQTLHTGDLSFTQMRLIAELLRLRSVSAASDSLGLSQPAASHALAKLRRQFGDPLFTRTTKGFQPTPYGERLGTAAREAVATLVAGIAGGRQFDPAKTTRCFNL